MDCATDPLLGAWDTPELLRHDAPPADEGLFDWGNDPPLATFDFEHDPLAVAGDGDWLPPEPADPPPEPADPPPPQDDDPPPSYDSVCPQDGGAEPGGVVSAHPYALSAAEHFALDCTIVRASWKCIAGLAAEIGRAAVSRRGNWQECTRKYAELRTMVHDLHTIDASATSDRHFAQVAELRGARETVQRAASLLRKSVFPRMFGAGLLESYTIN